MQQIRYFVALARTLSFTRAAEECNVTQPALTRAVQALEAELGGELIRRERQNSHLTELGKRMLPLLQRCYDSALNAKELARSIGSEDVAPLSVGISNSVGIDRFLPSMSEVFRSFSGLQLRILRGGKDQIVAYLKDGEADIAIAGPLQDEWERLDHWDLFGEGFELIVPSDHPLARDNMVMADKIKGAAVFYQEGCESQEGVFRELSARGASPSVAHNAATPHDVLALVEARLGLALLPASAPVSEKLRRLPVQDLEMKHSVSAYAVAGRQRSPAAAAFLSLVRSSDYSAPRP